ncbi:bifunctional glutamate N-acetyltransferase/amino-acid acetyltransferase ArgJ [Aquibaculum arenosum]|uniref:Arginine biosynthesis bifunctional protein ArgJ n=1 Tax=Aquibaculum arenosum TaxID=3032591 RepID=A0ABT5YNI2_9PROT|nr:bifunctional glutamate N-acetyltransferase/amino-acid acetyltransferase ArgJ [Fodinicurvata sp. CAU 1616]MDF2096402.1 bifunctional glutamate N-acetyltransferase/amino-acid acetyltransferase ArgJ [Fodinicurvata sp. CAU 1616]
MLSKSPLAPEGFPVLPAIPGVELATAATGIRYRGRDDVLLMRFAEGTAVAGVLTRSLTAGAPVVWCREALAGGSARAVLVNAGNANAFTGSKGMESVRRTVKASADQIGCRESEVFIASTGVIGEVLPDEKITAHLGDLAQRLAPHGWEAAARAIMTTDTFHKGASRKARIDGVEVTLNGIAKGSGMIAPDMATMLAFVATDAALPPAVLQRLLTRANDRSFNSITVDGDTSTSDTLLLAATSAAGNAAVEDAADPRLRDFYRALESLLIDLAQQVVRDGEGAQKFVTIEVRGAASARAARRIGLSIANSPLVKTAIAGEDANWGRVVMAVGKAGEKADRDRLSVAIGGVTIAEQGQPVEGYDEAPVAEHMRGRDILIQVDIGIGRGKARVWTCDLTHGYIDINADYRS